MSLLSNIFDTDQIRIMEVNKKYMIILVILIVGIICVLLIEKENYYVNKITRVGENIVLITEKDIVDKIKNNNKIIINDIENDYSINRVEVSGDICLVYINLEYNMQADTYKIYLGKEKVFDYIIRILKK